MASFLEGAKSQYIDNYGKTRIINYGYLSLITSPIPPLDLPLDRNIKDASLSDAISFIEEKGLQISFQDGTSSKIKGLWLEPKDKNGIYYGYIPLKRSPPIEDVPFSSANRKDPIRTDKTSKLQLYRRTKKIADFLKQYTLFTYAQKGKLDIDDFIVDPDHVYNIESLNRRLINNNNVIYKAGKIIVDSEETRDKLLSFLKVSLLNDTPGILKLKDGSPIEDYYQNISDFKNSESQLIFLTKNGIKRWIGDEMKKRDINSVSSTPLDNQKEPYFYTSPNIRNGQLMLIQNTQSKSLESAVSISMNWLINRSNLGYKAAMDENVQEFSYRVYTESGESDFVKKESDEICPVLLYENGDFASIIFFN